MYMHLLFLSSHSNTTSKPCRRCG